MDLKAQKQNIIVGLAVLAVLFGLYDLTVSSRPKKGATPSGAKSAAELQAFVMKAAADGGRNAKADFDAYVVSNAEMPLVRNPFFEKAPESSHSGFSYTGFLQAEGRGIAIINREEYKTGEELENREGYFVKEITPSRVIIENRSSKTEIAVPLQN